jgi:hypothetical protein
MFWVVFTFHPIHLVLVEILSYGVMNTIFSCLNITYFELMHWWNLNKYTCFFFVLVLRPFFLWWWSWDKIYEVLCNSRVNLSTSAWRIRWNIFWLLWNHWGLMLKLFLIFIKGKRNKRLRYHWLFKTFNLFLHLIQLALHFLNFR